MRIRPGRLFWKLFIAFTLATGTSFFVGVAFMQWIWPEAGAPSLRLQIPVQIAQRLQKEGIDQAQAEVAKEDAAAIVTIIDVNGRWIAGSHGIGVDAPTFDATAPDGERYRLRVKPSEPFKPDWSLPLAIGAFVSLFFSAGVAWYLARPLIYLSRGFRDVAAGRLATRLHPHVGTRRDEIADLTREFDSMAAQLQQLMASQERLLHDISHELRSPLARLQMAIGLLRQSPEDISAMLARVDRETERLDQLIEEVLTFARLKSGTAEFAVTQIDVIDILTAIVDDANFEAQAKGCVVRFSPSGPFITMAYGELLYRAYENVIRNAVKFSPDHAEIKVRCGIEGERLIVQVEDQGPGVPADWLTEIFEPFKGTNCRYSRNDVGFGLGLAIAKYAVERHHGTINASLGASGHGLQMEIILPIGAPR